MFHSSRRGSLVFPNLFPRSEMTHTLPYHHGTMLRLAGKMRNETSMRAVRRTYIDDVAFLKLPLVGNPMTYHFVDRTAIDNQIRRLYLKCPRATHVQTDLGKRR
jgi:hypothetical protein